MSGQGVTCSSSPQIPGNSPRVLTPPPRRAVRATARLHLPLLPCGASLYLPLPRYPLAGNARAWPRWQLATPRAVAAGPDSSSPSPRHPSMPLVPLPTTLAGWPAWARFVLAVPLSSQDLSNPQHGFWGAPGLASNWSSDPEGKAAASCPEFRTWQGKDAVMEVEIPVQGSLGPFPPALLVLVP